MAILSSLPVAVSSLAYLGILLIAAKLGEEAFRKVGLIPFVGAILVGTLLGPGVFNIVEVLPTITLFISIGIDFLLFVSGAEEFESDRLRRVFVKKTSLLVAVAEFIVRFLAITTTAYLLFNQITEALIIGIVVGMSSAGPLSRLLTDTGLARTDEGTAIFSQVLVIEVAAVVLYSFVFDLAGKAITVISVAVTAGELVAAVLGIIGFGRYVMVPVLEKVEIHLKSREAVFAVIISILLIAGFAGQVTGFNAAIVALFLGLLMQRFLAARPVLMEKLRAFTYGFFEPMFFAGLGLYFVRITPALIVTGMVIFGVALASDAAVGAASAGFFQVDRWRNAFGTCVNGGVDAALLVSAFTAGSALIGGFVYSSTAVGIALLSLTAPLLFRRRAELVSIDHEAGTQREVVKQHLQSMTAAEIGKVLPTVVVRDDELVKDAFKTLLEFDARAAVVVSAGKPIATLLMRDVIGLSRREMAVMKVSEAPLAIVPEVGEDEPGLNLVNLFRETNIPIIAVVDEKGRLLVTILEREILRRLAESLDE
ncbi:MAG: cation:proton antiporter [Nitrososphaerota archaeon]|nr:cation:proton antiporter [Nitrososphaerota archaeon]MDG7022919.1 cation:proton antiporter [Nitrososphaerota archaeon]